MSSDPQLTAEDVAYRKAAETYFAEKGPLARANFEPELLAVFQAFEEHWQQFFAPDDPDRRSEYLSSPFEVRQARFERFRRQCRAWEISFRHCTRAAAQGGDGNGDWRQVKRRLDEQRAKTEQVREFYDNLDSMLDEERRKRSHPMEMLPHLRALGVPVDAGLDDIKRQYKRLAKQHHPDRQGDALKMSELNDAYRALLRFHNKLALAQR